jgi:type 1 fimbriae regulatory protein FimB/type 1 fimbriae regulatory protein FimE
LESPSEKRALPENWGRSANDEIRGGKTWLSIDEVDALRRAAARGPHGHRDSTMILIAFRHGLRATELGGLRWEHASLTRRTLFIRRAKDSFSGEHPLERDEVAALKKLCPSAGDRRGLIFLTQRGSGFTRRAIHLMIAKVGESAGIGLPVHPHMLRHACGYHMINKGFDLRIVQAWLGHKNVQNTTRYTVLAPNRFAALNIWGD